MNFKRDVRRRTKKHISRDFFSVVEVIRMFRAQNVVYSDSAVEGHMPHLSSHYESSADDLF